MLKIAVVLLVGFVVYAVYTTVTSPDSSTRNETQKALETDRKSASVSSPVREENGMQIIRVLARGGYSPKTLTAKAGIPTRLELETRGTYDCSSAFTIPALSYEKQLPPTGVTDVEIGTYEKGSELLATCSMGMYSFTVNFE